MFLSTARCSRRSILTFAAGLLMVGGVAQNGRAEAGAGSALEGSDLGVVLPLPDSSGKWTLASKAGRIEEGRVSEVWSWTSDEDGKADFSVRVEFKRQVPPPPASEIARAFSRAASRTSYASTVVDTELSADEQWVEYTLPMQGEAGFKKIIRLKDGYVTMTLPNSDKFEAEEGTPERTTWDKLVESLRNAKVSGE